MCIRDRRTPMTTIKGFIDGMLDGTIPPENQNHYLGIVSQEVGRLTRLIKNMLDITKLEAGEYKVNATTYDIWESITSCLLYTSHQWNFFLCFSFTRTKLLSPKIYDFTIKDF